MSLQMFHSTTPLPLPSCQLLSRFVTAASHVTNCSTRSPLGSSELQSQSKPPTVDFRPIETKPSSNTSDDTPENDGISGIQVPRQRYIAASKSQLLDAITTTMFNSRDEAHQFRHLSLCLDLILHAEHKVILEEMRVDYDRSHTNGSSNSTAISSGQERDFMPRGSDIITSDAEKVENMDKYDRDTELKNLWPSGSNQFSGSPSPYVSFLKFVNNESLEESRTAVSSRFQHAFLQLLSNAGFEELSARDLRLTSALNTDYLLTLPISVDWKSASQSRAILFRRGYATERQKGLLIVEKLDYLQSKFLQRVFFLIVKPLKKVSIWLTEVLERSITKDNVQIWAKKIKLWSKSFPIFQQTSSDNQHISNKPFEVDTLSENDLPLLKAALNAVTRYEENLSAAGPRGRLLKKLLVLIGVLPSTHKLQVELEIDDTETESHLRPIFLSRISLSDIWEPASRKLCGNDFWRILKTSISILLSKSTLQEPAYQELILLYFKETCEGGDPDKAEFPSLQLKIYEKIPIPDLPVVFPHKKLSFRILDSVRLDIASVFGLLAYFINYKFENIFSPSAILLDVIAVSALVIYVSRVVLGYKQTWDRYQLLVNRTLNEKTIASGFGSVYFLLDASEQQQYKEAILAYAVLLKENSQENCAKNVGARCEKFIYDLLDEKVEMPVDKAINTLVRLGIVTEDPLNGTTMLQAVPCCKAYEILKQHWNSLLG
ncbi:uncharacterized protein LOC132636094 isoform X2 [Lycium barbarum]|uniref:uncharacterized protein LOC132636094 isoform X2 n=1 Tax=Lycium barbarum TaxID=112863 RepID=UPI00293EF749|nr:uncharacterized protein LOC132636094 isoform X2 [Lycium barbarum]